MALVQAKQIQEWLDWIDSWTKEQKMMINGQKTKSMISNFTDKYQFSTRLSIDDEPIEVSLIGETLGLASFSRRKAPRLSVSSRSRSNFDYG
jgi:hypothetical protein